MRNRTFLPFLTAITIITLTAIGTVAYLRPQAFTSLSKSVQRNLSGNSTADVVAHAKPGVVIVIAKRATYTATAVSDEQPGEEEVEPQQNSSDPTTPEPQRGTGTGFIVDTAGLIVTNNHVIRGADRIRVKLADGRSYQASVQGTDAETDLALLKIEAENLTALSLGDSDTLRPGDPVIAIGNPLEYEYSVTAGIVSAKGRKVYNNPPFEEYIQTDAAINRGNSGGPLLNLAGEVIGVNTIIRADGRGISFAVPGNIVRRVVAQLKAQGFVARGFLGLQPQNLTSEFREVLGLKEDARGVVVVDVTADKPAARAGIQNYDIITRFDGREIRHQDDFFSIVASTEPQREVEIVLLRNAQTLHIKAILERRQDETSAPPETSPARLQPASQKLGFTVSEKAQTRALRVSDVKPEDAGAVVVTEVDPLSSASDAGIFAGEVILEINRQPVRSLADFQRIVEPLKSGSAVALRVSSPRQKIVNLIAFRVE